MSQSSDWLKSGRQEFGSQHENEPLSRFVEAGFGAIQVPLYTEDKAAGTWSYTIISM
jgi:hypothetical protein